MKKITLLYLIVLSSCSTSYKPLGFGGGYTDQRIAEDMFQVSFQGNGYTGKEKVQSFLLKRCAEVTIENGYTHFIILNNNSGTDINYMANHQGTYGYGKIQGQSNIVAINKHSNSVVIRIKNNPSKEEVAYDADFILGNNRSVSSLPRWE